MRCSVLRDFFLGRASVNELVADLAGARERTGHDAVHHHMEDDLTSAFALEPSHLVLLCDAVLVEAIEPNLLR